MNIDEKIIKATKFEDSNMLTEAMDEISLKISEAINPVSRISAPFAVFCLREYADAIECQFPETKSLAKSLEKFFKQTIISIPTKRGEW